MLTFASFPVAAGSLSVSAVQQRGIIVIGGFVQRGIIIIGG